MIDRKIFFNYVRNAPFSGRLTSGQVDGMNRILDEWERRRLTDLRHLAYMLATPVLETGGTMQPVREGGGERYLRSKRYYPWVGEGLVQVTWEENHRKFGATAPGQLMTWPKALAAMFDGMQKGMFTGKKLSDYFNDTRDDPLGARSIIQGKKKPTDRYADKAELVAGHYRAFLTALRAATGADPEVRPEKATERNATPDDVPAEGWTLRSLWTAIFGGGFVLPFGVDNPWAFATIAVIVLVAALFLVAWQTGWITINRPAPRPAGSPVGMAEPIPEDEP